MISFFPEVELVTNHLIQRVCVFCGSSTGARSDYAIAATALGSELARRGLGLVYGGSSIGLMSLVADAVLAGGGEVIGVMPVGLQEKEIFHQGLTRLEIVPDMAERKQLMSDLSDAFIALPGGFGTLDELFEVLTSAQLDIHSKPMGILNICGYFDPMLAFFDTCVTERFVHADHRDMLLAASEPATLLDSFDGYVPPVVEKWVQ